MFVLLHSDFDPSELISRLEALGVIACRAENGLYLSGEVYRLDPAWLRAQSGVAGVIPMSEISPLSGRGDRPDTVVTVGNVHFGGGHFSVIAGPCAVESMDSIEECAAMVCRSGANMLRGGAFKPRTSPYHYQGMGEEGLRLLREAGKKYSLPVAAELMCPQDCDRLGEYIDLVQIGARNMQNFVLLRAVGKLGKPVLLKRGFCATQDEWLSAAEYILAAGNPQVILCERGIRTFEPGQRFTLDLGAVAALKKRTHLPILVDPSHAAGRAELVTPLALAAICAGADGLMVEAHPVPENALCDGLQALNEPQLASLITGAGRLCDTLRNPA